MSNLGFSGRLRSARHQAGLSQGALGERVGVALQTVHRWEQGHTAPDLNSVRSLADALGVGFAWLATGEGDPPVAATEPTAA